MIDNSLIELLEKIEPQIHNIEENRVELKSLKSVKKTMDELLEGAKDSFRDIVNFYDQDFVIRSIKISNSNYKELIDKYNSSKYLLETLDSNIQELPQYQEALEFMSFLYECFSGLSESINQDYNNLKDKLEIQEILNKYYGLLKKDNIFIKDIPEFLTFIEMNDLNVMEKINIYKMVINSNLKQYLKSPEIELDNGIEIENIEKLLNENEDLLNKDYVVSNDLKIKLDDYLKLVSKIDEDLLLNRKIYLIHKIRDYYNLKQYIETIDYYKEFIKIEKLQKEFDKQKVIPRELLFVYKGDQSLVRKFINETEEKYKYCVLKNLIDIENENTIVLPKKKYNDIYLYIKNEYVVKTVYTFLENGKVLILGVMDKDENINDFLEKDGFLFQETLNNINTVELIDDERDLLLKNIKYEDLMLKIDLETLDIKRED